MSRIATMLQQRAFKTSSSSWHCWAIFWYLLLGLIHELVHWMVALTIASLNSSGERGDSDFTIGVANRSVDYGVGFWYHLLIGRTFFMVNNMVTLDDINIVRHAGWIGSLLVALRLECQRYFQGTKDTQFYSSPLRWAAWVTALEALWTDLFQFPVIPFLLGTATSGVGHGEGVIHFCCGNFGMIILHHAWWTNENEGNSILSVLEKLVQVTMMRGAQSGGVVCFHPNDHHKNAISAEDEAAGSEIPNLRGVRSRVVNRKRTDLSISLRQKVSKDNHFPRTSRLLQSNIFPTDFTPVFCGHTRFATSSKATLPDTHPQQWTPASPRRVYNLDYMREHHRPDHDNSHLVSNRQESTEPQVAMVENFITHNGDFDFYRIHGRTFEVGQIQKLLELILHCPQPAAVDSCGVAGMIDLLRTRGCFGLSARHALCLGMPTSLVVIDSLESHSNEFDFPPYNQFENIGCVFEHVLSEMLKTTSLSTIDESTSIRESFASRVASKLEARQDELFVSSGLSKFIRDGEDGASMFSFCTATIQAFFDNDLLFATQTFLANASGSFGLCVTSSLDANRQLCLAARGQTMSLAVYPRKGIMLYGSEQAAVKAGMGVKFPGDAINDLDPSLGDVDNDALRLDLDDLGGEVVLLDFDKNRSADQSPVSRPNQHLLRHKLMNGQVTAVVYKESKVTSATDPEIYHRMVRLSRNKFVKPLPETDNGKDLVLKDIESIPRICASIQSDWQSDRASTSLNRLTAYTLSRALRRLMDERIQGNSQRSHRSIDILLTGCEVSLWLAEQFASDLQKAFPKLNIAAVSSNKLLGLYGQDIRVPAFGFPQSPRTLDLHNAIVIIVSHSGGTFAPLACSNLLQSATNDIFVVTSEWDTQIGKQLMTMDANGIGQDGSDQLFRSRIFSTGVGIRPAEPCSISVVATHQLLTNLFEYISVLVISDMRYRQVTGATISEQDLQIIERCNRENIDALSEIVGMSKHGIKLQDNRIAERELRKTGDLWADHILENARAYIMSFVYIFVTVITGYPIAFAIASLSGLDKSNDWMYAIHALDAAIYFWMPQINVILVRLIQGRNLRHRMVGRTVVIGDIPWVAQCAEAFLSKLFAVSYSIAGLNVMSGNPADHFVHRHTHRVVRGSLVVCGRPDGRLSALTSAEAAVCLSVNQASSIQSFGGTCESITIGHNPFKLPLTTRAIFLKRKRPLFLCERILLESDAAAEQKAPRTERNAPNGEDFFRRIRSAVRSLLNQDSSDHDVDVSLSYHRDSSVRPVLHRKHSASVLLGKFRNFEESGNQPTSSSFVAESFEGEKDAGFSVDTIVSTVVKQKKWSDHMRNLFEAFDVDNDGLLTKTDFEKGWTKIHTEALSPEELNDLFHMADKNGSGALDYQEFHDFLFENPALASSITLKVPPSHRDNRGLIQIKPSHEKYFGELLRKYNTGKNPGNSLDFSLSQSQQNAMELYETRIGSLQRFVAMTVMFHQMGLRVERFFESISFGLWGYRMDRTHSIMRIATTASPISGADIREQMYQLRLLKRVKLSVNLISTAWLRYKRAKDIHQLAHQLSSNIVDGASGNDRAENDQIQSET